MAQLLANLELERSIRRDAELPVGIQLLWQLRALIQGGSLQPGEQLPSVRELAELCDVNVNTARSAYSRLEGEGLIVSRQGAGTFVSEGAPIRPQLTGLASEAISSARAAGVEPHELAAAIYFAESAPASPVAPPAPSHEAPVVAEEETREARRELRRQIARLEARLAAYADPEPRRAVLPEAAPREPGSMPRVASLAELERTRDRLLERLREANREAERRGQKQRRARRKVDEMAEEPSRHKWEWVSSEDTGDPDCKTWDVSPQWGPIGVAMGWWRIKVSGGCPLCGAA